MNNLDDVIETMEKCTGPYIECDDCKYTCVNAEGVTICDHDGLDKDALHYLREYRDLLNRPRSERLIDVLREVRGEK